MVYEINGRAPHGARGLKHTITYWGAFLIKSRPARGAWIETPTGVFLEMPTGVAPRTGRVD